MTKPDVGDYKTSTKKRCLLISLVTHFGIFLTIAVSVLKIMITREQNKVEVNHITQKPILEPPFENSTLFEFPHAICGNSSDPLCSPRAKVSLIGEPAPEKITWFDYRKKYQGLVEGVTNIYRISIDDDIVIECMKWICEKKLRKFPKIIYDDVFDQKMTNNDQKGPKMSLNDLK